MENEFSLSDQVIARIAQIVQEGMLLGIDVVDLLRQIRVTNEVNLGVKTGQLVLTDNYRQLIKSMHDKLLEEAEQLSTESKQALDNNSSFLIKG